MVSFAWMRRIQASIAALAALLLFWGLADKYLWQDEAIMAVLAARLLHFGRPLAYDGVNLLTTDTFAAEDEYTIGQRTGSPQAALEYHVRRGDFKPDTTWKWQPWGQFVVAAIGLKLLGHTTLGARLPFTLAGFATVLLLFHFVRRRFDSLPMAALAALLLAGNAYWILHARQARYYPLSSLFLVLALMAYARWQSDAPRGAMAFVATAWCWFQVDYGTVFPVLAILFLDAFLAAPRRWRRTALVGVALSAALAPFAWYYELWGRRSVQEGSWWDRAQDNLFNMNEYVAPALVLLAALALLAWRWKRLPSVERRLVAVSIAMILALVLWVPTVAPFAFLRYIIMVVPAAALVAAWLLVRAAGSRIAIAGLGAAVFIVTPWMSLPLHAVVLSPDWYTSRPFWRSELSVLAVNAFGHRPDPNRLVVEWLQRNAAPSDQILINYEDAPLIFYLPNPIRGGIAAFRVEDDSQGPPRFAVLRRSVPFVHWPVFDREVAKYQWQPVPLQAPDIVWGNNPDPIAQTEDPRTAPDLFIARRVN